MEIVSLFLLLAFLAGIIYFITRPFFGVDQAAYGTKSDPTEHERSTLLAERDQVLNALYELDLDYELGKIPQGDYQRQRVSLLEKGSSTLKQLDSLEIDPDQQVPGLERSTALNVLNTSTRSADSSDQIPTVNNRLAPAPADPNDELEALLASRRRTRQEKALGFCPKCGGPLNKSDQFCPKCGAKLAQNLETQSP